MIFDLDLRSRSFFKIIWSWSDLKSFFEKMILIWSEITFKMIFPTSVIYPYIDQKRIIYKLRNYSAIWKLVVMILPCSWKVCNGFSKLVVPQHACGKFSTLVVPRLQITRGFATRDLQFGHHSCGKCSTLVLITNHSWLRHSWFAIWAPRVWKNHYPLFSYMEITHYPLFSYMEITHFKNFYKKWQKTETNIWPSCHKNYIILKK
jgi:hypothetical protein